LHKNLTHQGKHPNRHNPKMQSIRAKTNRS
jgi:hypothetical protein